MYPLAKYEEAMAMLAKGLTLRSTSELTALSRSTLREWRDLGPPGNRRGLAGECPIRDSSIINEAPYAYLLGLYLGDGCLSEGRRGVISIAHRPGQAVPQSHRGMRSRHRLHATHPDRFVWGTHRPGYVEVRADWKHWQCFFPQHGPGEKHERRIRWKRGSKPSPTSSRRDSFGD
jgi:hypothetical protein